MWSEFLSTDSPQVNAVDASGDQTLDFEQMRLGPGVAYLINNETTDTVGLDKAWVEIDSKRFLVESTSYVAIKVLLDKLQASVSRPQKTMLAKATFTDRRKLVAHAAKPKTGA